MVSFLCSQLGAHKGERQAAMVVVVGNHLAQLLRGQLDPLAVSSWQARNVAPDDL